MLPYSMTVQEQGILLKSVYYKGNAMDIERATLKAVARYKKILQDKSIKPDNCAVDGKDPTSLPHILWMLNHLEKNIKPDIGTGFSVDKFSRWLGFCQGILISKKLTTVEIERNITREWFNANTL